MTSAGPEVAMNGLEPIQLLPAAEAQDYIRGLVAELSRLDGAPVFMVHDGRTGTAHDLIRETANAVVEGGPIEDTRLFEVLTRLLSSSTHTVRIWWADDTPTAFLRVEQCHALNEAIDKIRKQGGDTIALRVTLQCENV
jgi:hypothetical protein